MVWAALKRINVYSRRTRVWNLFPRDLFMILLNIHRICLWHGLIRWHDDDNNDNPRGEKTASVLPTLKMTLRKNVRVRMVFPRRRRRAKPAISSLSERRRWVFNGDAAARRKHVGGHETLTPLDCVEKRIKPNHKSVEVLPISDH